MIYYVAEESLKNGNSIIVEANFNYKFATKVF